jgi:hypothetical protein
MLYMFASLLLVSPHGTSRHLFAEIFAYRRFTNDPERCIIALRATLVLTLSLSLGSSTRTVFFLLSVRSRILNFRRGIVGW